MAVLSRAELRRRERQRRKAVKKERIHRDIIMKYKCTGDGKAAVIPYKNKGGKRKWTKLSLAVMEIWM